MKCRKSINSDTYNLPEILSAVSSSIVVLLKENNAKNLRNTTRTDSTNLKQGPKSFLDLKQYKHIQLFKKLMCQTKCSKKMWRHRKYKDDKKKEKIEN